MHVVALSHELARRHASRLAELLSAIPGLDVSVADVLASHRFDVPRTGRWQHSFIVVDRAFGPVGVLLTYERPAEPATPATGGEVVYPSRSFYLDGIAVDPVVQHQGIGSSLIDAWLASTATAGFAVSDGPLAWSLQTNAAPFNEPVRHLYRRFGFVEVGEKAYSNRTDVVMWRPGSH